MCGIILIRRLADTKPKHGKIDTRRELMEAYRAQKTRGTEGFGFLAFEGERWIYKRARSEKEIFDMLEKIEKPLEVLFHHRYPTSTQNLAECAHPIKVDNAELENVFYVVHNGVITNTAYLKDVHEKLGYSYNTLITMVDTKQIITSVPHDTEPGMVNAYSEETKITKYNDSESLAIELARVASGKQEAIGTSGSVAFMMIEMDRSGKALKLHYGRNEGNPLGVRQVHRHIIVSSQGGEDIKANVWHTLDYATGEVTSREIDIGNFWKKPLPQQETMGFRSTENGDVRDYGDEYWERKYGRTDVGEYRGITDGSPRKLEWDEYDDTKATIRRIEVESDDVMDEIDQYEREREWKIFQAQMEIYEDYVDQLFDTDANITLAKEMGHTDKEAELRAYRDLLIDDVKENLGNAFNDIQQLYNSGLDSNSSMEEIPF